MRQSIIFLVFFLAWSVVLEAKLSCRELTENTLSVEGCPFCHAYKSSLEDTKPEHFDKTVILYSRHKRFFLKVQRGGFLPGSVLIASRSHDLTRISDMTEGEFNEFFEFYKIILAHIKETFGVEHTIAFENGTVGSDTVKEASINDQKGVCRPDGGGCLSHFHWHINTLETKSKKSHKEFMIPPEAKKIESWVHFRSFMFENPSKLYTLIEYNGGLYFVDRSVHKRRSEWIRLLLSFYLKEEGLIERGLSYSWRVQPNDDISLETLNRLRRKYGLKYMPVLPQE